MVPLKFHYDRQENRCRDTSQGPPALFLTEKFYVTASGYATENHDDSEYDVQSAYPPQSVDLLTILRQNGITTFVDLIVKAGLEETFSQNGPRIVLTPTNEAFAVIDPGILATIINDIDLLRDILTYHLVFFRQPFTIVSAILHELALPTAQGGLVRFNLYRQRGSSFATEDIATANGAPLLRAIPAGEKLIYVIDRVLNPKALSPNNTLQIFLENNKDLSIFLRIYNSVIITQNTIAVFPKTIFVPTNAAFKALPPGVLDSLFANPRELVVLLNTHMASGTFYAAGLTDGPLTVFSGATVDVDVSPSGITVGKAKIIRSDISLVEGVVHVSDSLVQAGPTYIERVNYLEVASYRIDDVHPPLPGFECT
ncbi:transforming growth factor-beta-induced protein ig-h3 [Daphnia magna]|uniref:transforming growth factor-beta-induced protein ig-h3 n=1 Tax=Daphnia magna TaxID=35525 RepID=UPI001E1BCB1B|nr:transforming growth factor-beta-induced protein ig-h3 [Daphnia magna]